MEIRVAIVGFGFIAEHGHTPYYVSNKDKIRVVSIMDSCKSRLDIAKRYFPTAKLFSSANMMIRDQGSNIEVIDICAPPYCHYESVNRALEHGYHVLCEKPVLVDSSKLSQLHDKAKRQSLVIYPCHNYQFSPAFKEIRRIISSGTIGTPQKVFLHTYRVSHAKGVAQWKPDWRREKKYSLGGILADHGPHSAYVAHLLLGASNPKQLSCIAGNLKNTDYSTEDTVQLEIEYEQGKQASIFLSWASSFRSTRYLIIGTSGYVELNDDVIFCSGNGKSAPQNTQAAINNPSHSNWFPSMFEDFENLIKLKSGTITTPWEQISLVAAIIEAGYRSMKENGNWTPIKGLLNENQ